MQAKLFSPRPVSSDPSFALSHLHTSVHRAMRQRPALDSPVKAELLLRRQLDTLTAASPETPGGEWRASPTAALRHAALDVATTAVRFLVECPYTGEALPDPDHP